MRICYLRPQKLRKMNDGIERECIQCGRCGGVCPIGRVRSEISPRKTLFRIVQDRGKRLDRDREELWMCVTCYACDEICPQGVKLVNLMFNVRNHLSMEKMPDSIKEMIKTIKEEGTVIPCTMESKRLRKDLGLEELRKPDIQKILKISNF